MDTMTPEQRAAHAALSNTLQREWEEYCDKARDGHFKGSGGRCHKVNAAIIEWVALTERTFGCAGTWVPPDLEDYEIAGEYYVWIP